MITVVLDPGLLAYVENTSRIALLSKIERLVNWSKLSGTQPWLKLALVPSAREVLEFHRFIPAYDSAQLLLEKTGLRYVYSPLDIIRPVYDLLQKALADEYCCVADELHQNFKSEPAQPWHGNHTEIESLSEHALLLSALENRIHQKKKFSMFASAIDGDIVKFTAQLDMVLPDSIPGLSGSEMPQGVEDEFRHVFSIENIYSLLKPELIWAGAKSGHDLKFAVQLTCRKRMIEQGTYTGFDGIPLFFVGAEFLSSLQMWQADGENKFASQTLECCAAAILGLETIEIKPFGKARRAADLAEPQRAHISKAGVGLRLMMWERPGKHIEFANVGGKKEEEITYSNPALAV